ncbi:MAG TPA: hypothetical protein VMG12_21680 [Polyangiaceae bacterium]|nr:hypothetical protein [Polyangiaceae bacterium]
MALLVGGCRCSSDPAPTQVVASAPADVPDCVRQNVLLTLSPSDAQRPSTEAPLDPDVELPFATEPGMALAFAGGFYATGQRHEARGAVALLGRVGADDAPTQLIELGHLRGDVLPPRLATDGTDLWVALQEATPQGRELRVGRLVRADLNQAPVWRVGPEQSAAESNGFDIAAQPGVALLVYDDWSATGNHGRILAATVGTTGSDSARIEGRAVSLPGVDAEAPRVTARPGGFWLTWLVNGSGAGAGRVYDPGDEQNERAAAGSAYGARWLAIVALDMQGKPIGDSRRLTARQERVVGYDLTTGPTGAAWVVWRQDAPTPGASGGRIAVAEVPHDGNADIRTIRDEDVGAGEPTWLFAGNDAARWLTFPDARDRTLLMRAPALRELGAPLRLGEELQGAGALAASGDRVLFALPHGRSLELFPAACAARSTVGVPRIDAGAAIEAAALEGSAFAESSAAGALIDPFADAGVRPVRAAP